MKRYTRFLALVLCCLLLTGCALPSDTVMFIDRIGTVTLDSGEDIRAAEQSYDRLFSPLKGSVNNYDTLVQARMLYDSMVSAQKQMEADIAAIGTVSISSEGALKKLREDYIAYRLHFAPETFEDIGLRLEDMEEEYHRCFLLEQMKTAEKLYEAKQYEEAIALADEISKDPQGAFCLARCESLKTRCDEALAQEKKAEARRLLDAKDPVGALDVLDSLGVEHVNDEEADALFNEAFAQMESRRPKNGKVLKKTLGSGKNVFKITLPEGNDVCVKLENVKDPGKYILFYVRAGKSASVKVPSGSYTMKYVSGEYWVDTSTYFYSLDGFRQADETMTFKSTSTTYTKITVKLEKTFLGNLSETGIDKEDF